MRKQNRIISLVIVLALLLSMLAAFAQVGAEGEAETFVPTATAEAMTSTVKDPVLAGTASNLATGVDATNWNDAVLGKYLWTEASGNKYLSLTTLADKSAGNHFFVVSTKVPTDPANKISFVKEGEEVTASGYYIVDFDFASETGYPNRFFISPNIGYPGHSSYTQRLDPDFSQKPLADMAGTADGNWHHFTLVGDLANNKSYAYIDGKFVADMGVAFAESADPNAAPDYTQEYYLSTVRVEVRGNQAIGVGNTLNLDNFGARTFAEDASLAAALEAKDLTAWDKNVANPTGSLPTVAKVDGTEVTMMSGLRAALATSDTSVNVEILRDFHDKITVDRPAVVDTHGLATGLVAGDGVKAVADGNVVTYSIPYRPNMTVEGTGNDQTIHKAISIKRADNIMTAFGTSNVKAEHTAGYSSGAIITNKLNGDKYFRWYDDGITSSSNVYAQLYSNTEITYETGVSQYMVYDFDFAYLCGGALFNLASVCRAVTSGTGGWGSNSGNVFGGFTSTWTPGMFRHVTVVMDFQTNQMIIYIDNVVFQTINNGIMSAGGFTKWTAAEGNKVKMEALRLGQNQNQTAAIDNTCVRYITDDESLANAIAAQNLSGWTDAILNESYVMPQCATVASVDGENVYSAEQLADKIALRGNHTAEIFCTLPEKVAVDGDAVVETHEFEVNFVLGDGVTSATEGSVITFDAPFKPSSTSTAPIPGGPSSDMLAAAAVSGIATIRHANLYTPRVNITVVTDATTGNKYIDFRSVSGPAATAHSFVEIETAPHAYTEDTFTVIDFDVAFEYDLIGEMYVLFNSRTPSGANATASSFVSEWGLEKGEWAHVTIVCDITNNVMNYYVNNKLATRVANSIYTGEIVDGKAVSGGAQISFYGMRINLNESNKLNTNQNFSLDNIKIAHGVSDQWLLDNPSAKSIEAWEGRTMNGEYKLPNVPTIAVIDGVEYKTFAAAEAALATGENHTVSLDRDFPGALKVASTATVATNGLTNSVVAAPGFCTEDNGNDIISVIKDKRVGNVTVTINGNAVINVNLPYGTDFAAYMSENHINIDIKKGINIGRVIIAGNKVYTGATWDTEPGIVNAPSTVYEVTATEFTGAFFVIKLADLSDFTSYYDGKTLDAALGEGIDKIIILNKDYRGNNATIRNKTTVYMLGHTISFANGGHHLEMADTANPTFIGGTLVDDSAITTNSLFYANYGFGGKIKLVNCQVYGISHIATMRGGTFTAENSTITVPMYQNTNPFEVSEYYNAGYTYNKVTLNLIDCKINYTAINSNVSAAFITAKDIDEWLVAAGETEKNNALKAGADKLVNEVNISGCTISIPKQASLLTVTQCKDDVANVEFNIDNTELFVKTLFTNMKGTVTIGEGVKSAAKLTTGVTLAEGVEEINSGNAMLPYAYSSSYANVTWSDGNTEKWADGSVPVNAACKNDSVRPVVAGETVTFTNSEFAPALKGNMTLNANLIFNLYVPKANDQHITKVTIGDVPYVIDGSTTVVEVAGADHYVFEYVMSPEVAAQTFTIVVENENGDRVSKNMSIAQYATLAEGAVPGSADLVKSLLAYVAEAHKYTSNYVNGFDAVDGYADPTTVTLPTSGTNEMSALSEYIASAQLNLNYGPKWRFNVKGGANISDLTVSVGDKVVEYTIGDGYIEVELPAYEMGKVITITVGEVSGQYDLAAYCAAQAELAASITLTGNRLMGESINAARALESLNLIKAFYTYVNYASAYKA